MISTTAGRPRDGCAASGRRPRALALMLARHAWGIQPQFAESSGKRGCIYCTFSMAPLLVLIFGLIVGNLITLPNWFKTALRTEYSIETGIVLLGATWPLTLIAEADPIAFLQATIASVTTWRGMSLPFHGCDDFEPQRPHDRGRRPHDRGRRPHDRGRRPPAAPPRY
jgi:hypothetical protein